MLKMFNAWLTKHGAPVAVLVTLLFCISALFIYVPKTLHGDFDKHFLPSEMFGIPTDLQEHGLSELYSKQVPGWDGQFYYYISNDILGVKDTPEHLDSSAYRYQRIGLPLLANIVSHLTFQSWVSPTTYYLTSLLLVLIATFMAARFFQSKGIHPLWALVWSFGFGTQVTLLNGLPDAAADALLIIAMLGLVEGRRKIYALSIFFAALSREVYVLVPFILAIFETYSYFRFKWHGEKNLFAVLFGILKNTRWHIPAMVAVLGWQVYIRVHFGVSPADQATGILAVPFVTIYEYLSMGFSGHHPLIGDPGESRKEAVKLVFYIALLVYSFALMVGGLRKTMSKECFDDNDAQFAGLYVTFLVVIGLYLSFGPTVIMYHTGFLKAGNIFLFIVPFVVATTKVKMGKLGKGFLIAFTVLVSIYAFVNKVNARPSFSILTKPDHIQYAKTEPACVSHPQASLMLLPIKPRSAITNSIFTRVMNTRTLVYQVKVKNTSDETYSPYKGKGSVNLSYQWLGMDRKVIQDGSRTWLTKPLKPGEETVRPVVVDFPSKAGDYILRFSLVQEGCFWFYERRPSSAYSKNVQIR